MATKSKDKIKAMVAKEMLEIHNQCMDVKKSINSSMESTIEYLHTLLAQIPQSASGPLITKTPKILRKKAVQRIETIPENDVIITDSTISESFNIKVESQNTTEENPLEVTRGRTKRKASEKAADSIRKQQSLSLVTKMRRPSSVERESEPVKNQRESRAKRKKHTRSSSDEESQGPTKHSKTDESKRDRTVTISVAESVDNNCTLTEDEKIETPRKTSSTWRSSRKRTLSSSNQKPSHNIMDDTVIAPKSDGLDDRSMYEDAIENRMPIMNSTMNLNTTHVIHKMMNVTVVLEPLSAARINETVTLNGLNRMRVSKSKSPRSSKVQSQPESKLSEPRKLRTSNRSKNRSPVTPKIGSPSSKPLQDRMRELKEAMVNKEFDDLITEDESSPEIKKQRPNLKKQEIRKRQKRVTRSVTSSEDEILNTPAKPALKEVNSGMTLKDIRGAYKSNALFSPYAKESVKKRVEAFEQVGAPSPMPAVDVDAPTRVTRTKTRALAAAQADGPDTVRIQEKSVAQKLARKSLAKAKKISLVKQAKETEEYKENKIQSAQKMQRLYVADKGTHPSQQKTTPLRKAKIQLPMSVSRIPQTPSNYPITHNNKPLSAARTNIVTSVESFIQTSKPTTNKRNSLDKLEEKKRRMNDEDARKKREDALRLQTEEKRRKRQEKELKNKLAREAKEKMEMEKRQRAEKEREEKARLAQQMQEKQREELEKKRMVQIQRAHEKEERRRLEEQQRLQRLQEQEEAERILAEQRRREQEAEKRKELEARAQQHANAEALRIKNQMLQAQAKHANKHYQGPTNYILDSEPDEDESDNENKPKHPIPYWAQPQVRRGQLAAQRHIPTKAILRFFDSRKCTPDLTELFQGIDRSRLKRTSSAIWKTPPRYSMMMPE